MFQDYTPREDCTGKPLQVSKAVGEGLIAAQMAAAYLDGHKS